MAENYYEKQMSKIEYYENKINELKNQHKICIPDRQRYPLLSVSFSDPLFQLMSRGAVGIPGRPFVGEKAVIALVKEGESKYNKA